MGKENLELNDAEKRLIAQIEKLKDEGVYEECTAADKIEGLIGLVEKLKSEHNIYNKLSVVCEIANFVGKMKTPIDDNYNNQHRAIGNIANIIQENKNITAELKEKGIDIIADLINFVSREEIFKDMKLKIVNIFENARDERAKAPLYKLLESITGWRERTEIVYTLVWLGDKEILSEEIERQIGQLKDTDIKVRENAGLIIRFIAKNDENAFRDMINKLKEKGKDIVPDLIKAINDSPVDGYSSLSVSLSLSLVLSIIGDSRSIQAIGEAAERVSKKITDKKTYTYVSRTDLGLIYSALVENARRAGYDLRGTEYVPKMIGDLLTTDGHPDGTTILIIEALGYTRDKRALQPLEKLFEDHYSALKNHSCFNLRGNQLSAQEELEKALFLIRYENLETSTENKLDTLNPKENLVKQIKNQISKIISDRTPTEKKESFLRRIF